MDIPFFHNITRQEHILPISLESDDFDEELLSAPKTLRELVERYKQKKIFASRENYLIQKKISFGKQHETLDKENENNNFIETSILNIWHSIFLYL